MILRSLVTVLALAVSGVAFARSESRDGVSRPSISCTQFGVVSGGKNGEAKAKGLVCRVSKPGKTVKSKTYSEYQAARNSNRGAN